MTPAPAPTPLNARLATALAISPTDATRRLCDDVRALASEYGDLAGCAYADALLSGVSDYADYNARLRPLCLSPAGVVLGERPPPTDRGCWWLGHREMKSGARPDMGWASTGAAVPEGATHWCESGGPGWWRVPCVEKAEARRAA